MRAPVAVPYLLLTAALLSSCSTQDDGASAPVDAPPTFADNCGTEPGRDEAGLVGLSEAAAEERVRAEDLVFRVVCVDGNPLDVTADARGDRVNAGVRDGIVTFTWRG